jgi:tetratricopeptide (TPR) repeat protein
VCSRRSHVFGLGALLAAAAPCSARADQVDAPVAQRFGELARKAEAAFAQAGPGAAIPLYEQGLAGFPDDYGRIHLRLGQLYQQLGRIAEAAAHFKRCDADTRVEAIDRELICQDGLRSATVPVELLELPPEARVLVVEPLAFAGPLKTGDRLPLGSARLLVEAPQHDRRETTVRVQAPAVRWKVELGAAYTDETNAEAPPEPASKASRRWPALALGATGLALVGAGLTLGFMNRGGLDDIRHDQSTGACGATHCRGDLDSAETQGYVADGLWMGGAGLTAAGVGLWLFQD